MLDEADRLLHLGFKPALTAILQRLPKQRRTGLFSASVSEAVEDLVRVGLRNPYRINVKVRSLAGESEMRTPAALALRHLTVPADRKLPTLLRLISKLEERPLRTIAYLPTCAAVDYLSTILLSLLPVFCPHEPLQIISLHGKHAQNHREKNLTRFTNCASPSLLLTTDVAARGLDIPAVDLVVQLDPPSDPTSFLHRAGRAGRAGRRGLAVVFLMPGRETNEYPSYLHVRKTPVAPLAEPDATVSDDEAANATAAMRDAVLKDRALHDKSQVAFPSYVQAYRKHQARSIFRVQELPWEKLARGWGLLKLPRMPELKGADVDNFLGLDIDWQTLAYKDKARERKRRAEMEQGDGPGRGHSERAKRKRDKDAWSKKRDDQEARDARRDKRERKRIKEKEAGMTPAEKFRNEELQSLIAQVRSQNRTGGAGAEEEFRGFD